MMNEVDKPSLKMLCSSNYKYNNDVSILLLNPYKLSIQFKLDYYFIILA